jgi:photosystem II stability/assembly factor-like uncharacterized protein
MRMLLVRRQRVAWSAWRLGVVMVVVVVAAGCDGGRSAPSGLPPAEDPGVVHVHGLGVNPKDGALYAATHTGLFVIRKGTAERVGQRWQDTMGFTVAGPDHFLGSGHPDPRDPTLGGPDRRPLLGLVESRDAGRSWQPVSLLGEADFHGLAIAHDRVYGADATGGRFMVTDDRKHWQVRSQVELLGFAVSPDDPDLVVAATKQGLVRSSDQGRSWQPTDGPQLVVLAWPHPRSLLGVTPDGQVLHSGDAGRSWERRGWLDGEPEALAVHEETLYAAVYGKGILTSADQGRSWQVHYRQAG